MIHIGLLWFDDHQERPFEARIEKAVARYVAKFGHAPNVCYVNPGCLPQPAVAPASLEVRTARDILPNHFMLGRVTPS
ncbi:MAG: hypothetical protein GX557_09505 [Chloroflexi bacterium]|nr:hypothetical protein [Chloroflexota bacterium]